jgi:hypothetical protein
MNQFRIGRALQIVAALALLALGGHAVASTLNQNVSWTINRPGTTTKYRIVAYGDSIYAGYNGSISNAARFAAPTVDAEYLSAQWNADIESVRRAKSGAIASDVYNNKIVAERAYMQAAIRAWSPSRCAATTACRRAAHSRARRAPATTTY